MATKYTMDDLSKMSSESKDMLIISMQDQLEMLNENIEKLIEQVRIANQYRFGRHTETMDAINGQLSFFDEAEAVFDDSLDEPDLDDILPSTPKKKKQKGKRDADLDSFEQEPITHDVTKEQLDDFYGEGNWKEWIEDDVYKRLRFIPSKWITEVHTVKVYVGTDGDHQDEFYRGDRPKDLIRGSILTPSLASAILNGKYVNSLPFYRMEQEFLRNGVNISRQDMANWTMKLARSYFIPFCERMKYHLLQLHVNQCDETPVQVVNDGGSPGSKSYMWVHRSGELYRDIQIALYEYQKGRHHHFPLEYYKDFKGVLVTDGLQQYHLVDKKSEGLTNANCWAHARRDYSDAIKAASKDLKGNPSAVKNSSAYQALVRISAIYKLDESLKDMTPEKRLKERQETVKPLVDEYFAWVKTVLDTMLPKGKTAEGLHYSINQEKYLRVFLEDGEVPIDNSASERAIRTFCVGKKNWLFFDSINGAEAGAAVYSITETAKLNNLHPYKYLEHLLTELPKYCDEDGQMDITKLDPLMPWAPELPDYCRKPVR